MKYNLTITTSAEKSIIHVNAPTHLPTKLTNLNFNVWCQQLTSTLIGFDLIGYIDSTDNAPAQFLDTANQKPNLEYTFWHRQDEIIVFVILGSCIDLIQPYISNVSTSQEAWEHLNVLYANKSRTRVMSLKGKLVDNPQGSRNVAEFMQEMHAISENLALADSLIHEEDLIVQMLNNLGPDFKEIVAAVRVCDSPISFTELHDKLCDFELQVKKAETSQIQSIATANYANRSKNNNRSQKNNFNQVYRNSLHYSTSHT